MTQESAVLLGRVAALSVGGVFVGSGVTHLLGRDEFRRTLHRQRVFPQKFVGVVTALFPSFELVLGASLISLLFTPPLRELQGEIFAGAGLFGLLLAIYSGYLVMNRPGVPCGCGAVAEPATGLTVARAAVMAVIMLLSSQMSAPLQPLEVALTSFIALFGGTSISLILWSIPLALADAWSSFDEVTA